MSFTHGDKCDARWSGNIVEHCPACHLTFGDTRAGDAHRVGRHELNERRCLTADELRARVVRNGVRKGEPWFLTRTNAYGTEIWFRNTGQNRLSQVVPEDSKQ